MSRPGTPGQEGARAERSLNLDLEQFAWEAIEEESTRLGVSVEEFVSFAVLYYLADIDSGRVSRRITRSPFPRPRDA